MKSKQLNYTIKIFGEGYTEWFYFEKLRTSNKFKFTIDPDIPQQSNSSYKKRLELIDSELRKKSQERADAIFLIIDLDNISCNDGAFKEYQKSKEKYKQKGVIFIESHPCIELWFLYHFHNSFSKSNYNTYDEIKNKLRAVLPDYDKTDRYFSKNKKFNESIINDLSSREKAIQNGLKSCKYVPTAGEIYNYSEMFKAICFFRLLKKFSELNDVLKEKMRASISLSLDIKDHKCMKILSNKKELCEFIYDAKGQLKLVYGSYKWPLKDDEPLNLNSDYVEGISKMLQ